MREDYREWNERLVTVVSQDSHFFVFREMASNEIASQSLSHHWTACAVTARTSLEEASEWEVHSRAKWQKTKTKGWPLAFIELSGNFL
jgi:hypothetical protein